MHAGVWSQRCACGKMFAVDYKHVTHSRYLIMSMWITQTHTHGNWLIAYQTTPSYVPSRLMVAHGYSKYRCSCTIRSLDLKQEPFGTWSKETVTRVFRTISQSWSNGLGPKIKVEIQCSTVQSIIASHNSDEFFSSRNKHSFQMKNKTLDNIHTSSHIYKYAMPTSDYQHAAHSNDCRN